MASSGLRCSTDAGRATSVFGVDKRYFTILNNLRCRPAPSPTRASATRARHRPREGLTVQFNVTNLFDESYIRPMGTGGYSLNSDLQTLQAGPKRLLTVGTTF
jgi:outer membrane receptor protein involved in Fe transport